ncbi:DnaJ subfamily C member protein [Echinococcus granulosus]|uniref:DnaJ homolog subfamily C member 2 n=1 Tax=Echinococcus granulosus TaxID=6210 RepID=W6V7W3_ECHGR|nr:DnaJ subfamily C member protein [Echinococcus granulosus]EUB62569.1 DnaJ subfamily C member protein [Echinococcus granulosus]
MSRRALKAVVVYNPHPHIVLFRELAGYKNAAAEDISDEDNTVYLRTLDPKDWRTNDHYAVLNLKKQRYRASDEDIRKQYRQLVLQHHPDKRRARAFEILGNSSKRHAYDSVDPFLPDYKPSLEEIKKDFFGTLNIFFLEKARWSKHQPTPFLGHGQSPLEAVYRFYDFWWALALFIFLYIVRTLQNLVSLIREGYETTKDFSFLDEEDKEKGEDREARRYIERCNRAERQRRRNEEHRKVHQIVDLARSHDPRLLAAEKAAREAKEARKRERLEAIQKRRTEEEARAKAESAAAEAARAAAAERQRQEAEMQRKEREQIKALSKKEKKRLRNNCVNRWAHFVAPARAENPSVAEDAVKLQTLQDVDLLCHVLSVVELADFNTKLENTGDVYESFSVWKAEVARARKESEAPGLRSINEPKPAPSASNSSEANSRWTFEMNQLLIKAVNLFPAGTQKRWEVIAAYVNQHEKGVEVTGKEALKQANNIRQDYSVMKHEANEKAFDSFASNAKVSDATKSVTITNQIEAETHRPWTWAEQRALEKALRENPTRPDEPSTVRWQRIADEVGTRTSRECAQRYKDLVEQAHPQEESSDGGSRCFKQKVVGTPLYRAHLH